MTNKEYAKLVEIEAKLNDIFNNLINVEYKIKDCKAKESMYEEVYRIDEVADDLQLLRLAHNSKMNIF